MGVISHSSYFADMESCLDQCIPYYVHLQESLMKFSKLDHLTHKHWMLMSKNTKGLSPALIPRDKQERVMVSETLIVHFS